MNDDFYTFKKYINNLEISFYYDKSCKIPYNHDLSFNIEIEMFDNHLKK